MPLTKLVCLLSLFWLILMSSGCVYSGDLLEAQSSQTLSPSLITEYAPNSTPIVSNRIFPATPTSKAKPVFTITTSPTWTNVPTLSVNDSQIKLLALLSNNGACRLPCLWGITPGISKYQEAKDILMPLSGISEFTSFTSEIGNITPHYTENDFTIYINVDFLAIDNLVTRIHFQGRILEELSDDQGERGSKNVFDSEIFGERLNQYMLPQILTNYGRPNSVMLLTLGAVPLSNRDPGVNFNVLLLYPNQGLLVHYTMEMQAVGKNMVGCPSNAHVELELYPSGNEDTFLELLLPSGWAGSIKNNYKPLEEVTSISLEEFYQVFRQPTEKCLETPAIHWPIPEK